MYNEALNGIKAQLLSAEGDDASRLRTLVEQRLDHALLDIRINDYVEDCLFQIREALQHASSGAADYLTVRDYLLGAIEALRDELHLCDIDMDFRQAAVGF